MPFLYIASVGFIAYGWVLHFECPLAAPLVISFFTGYSCTAAINVSNTLLVDFHPKKPATATAANNLVRCLMGAGATALIIPMIDALGRGWCFTLIGMVIILLSPMYLALMRWGPKWREERRLREEKRSDNAKHQADEEVGHVFEIEDQPQDHIVEKAPETDRE